ncbi:MAG TPA: hypothetical protein VMF06_06875 [Candidatus Limnocylindria bacterium]|jgi:hypothetical protein|nr:hypothetical protein [Candidatus Limnocylindria bacterium]
MPLYQFTNSRGEMRDFLAGAETATVQADGERWDKCRVQPFAIAGGVRQLSQKEEVLRGYYREECSGRPWRSRYSKQQVKNIWSDER